MALGVVQQRQCTLLCAPNMCLPNRHSWQEFLCSRASGAKCSDLPLMCVAQDSNSSTLPCSGSLPDVSGEFANLRILNVSGNSLNGTVPAALGGAAMFKQVSRAEPGSASCLVSGAWLTVAGVVHVGPALDQQTMGP